MAEPSGNKYGDTTASGQARLHLGDVRNNYSYHYNIRKRQSDETLHEYARNRVLLSAAAEGQTPRVRHLLHLGADFDYSDELGLTALHHACLSGFDDTAKVLLDAGADVNATSLNCGTPLHLAILKARKRVVQLLLQARAGVNRPSRLLGMSMHCAYYAGDVTIIELLRDVNAKENLTAVVLPSLMDSITAQSDLIPRASNFRSWRWDTLEFGSLSLGYLTLCCLPLHLAVANGHLSLLGQHSLLRPDCYCMLISDIDEQSLTQLFASQNILNQTLLAILFDQPRILSEFWKPASTDRFDQNESHARYTAIWLGRSQCLKALLRHEGTEDHSLRDLKMDFDIAIDSAQDSGDKSCLQTLLSHYALLGDRTKDDALIGAVLKGSMDIVECLLDHWSLSRVPRTHYALTKYAAKLASDEILLKLMSCGLDINASCSQVLKPRTLLMDAAQYGDKNLVRSLLEHGALMDIQDRNGDTALLLSVRAVHVEASPLSQDRDTTETLQNQNGGAVVVSDDSRRKLEIVSLLVNQGASLDLQDELGYTALHCAVEKNNVQAVTLLLHGSLSLDLANEYGNTALLLAASKGLVCMVSLLVHRGASLDLRNKDGNTAILAAILHDSSDCFGHGTPFMWSCKGIVSCLLEHNASTTIRNNSGIDGIEACLHVKNATERQDCIRLLLKALETCEKSLRTPLHCYLGVVGQYTMGIAEWEEVEGARSQLPQHLKDKVEQIEKEESITSDGRFQVPSVQSGPRKSWRLFGKLKRTMD